MLSIPVLLVYLQGICKVVAALTKRTDINQENTTPFGSALSQNNGQRQRQLERQGTWTWTRCRFDVANSSWQLAHGNCCEICELHCQKCTDCTDQRGGGEVGLAGKTRVVPVKVSAEKLTSIQCKLSRRVLIKLASKMKQKASAAARAH